MISIPLTTALRRWHDGTHVGDVVAAHGRVQRYGSSMIIAVVRFVISPARPADELAASFAASAPNYAEVDGLHRKHFLLDPSGEMGGGVYLWDSREAAATMYTEAWAHRLEAKFGGRPTVEYFDVPASVEGPVPIA
jgi:Putative mono-oxygenase ydhR